MAPAVFMTATPAWLGTVADALELFGAPPALKSTTLAVLGITVLPIVPAFTVWSNVKVCDCPAGSPAGHVIVPAAYVQVPAGPDDVKFTGAETFAAGAASVTISGLDIVSTGPCISARPALLTMTFHVRVWPLAGLAGMTDLFIPRS